MKTILNLVLVVLFINSTKAQIGIGTQNPDASAILELKSSNKGFLPPRLTNSQLSSLNNLGAVNGPARGLIIYNLDDHCLQVNTGTKVTPTWKCIGQNNSTTITVTPLPANITLGEINDYFIGSVKDSDYLPYTTPLVAATLAQDGDPDTSPGGTESKVLDVQGTLTTTGITIKIPYNKTGTGNVTLPAFTQTITIASNFTENGVANDITFTYPEITNITPGEGFINATLKAENTDLLVKQLDIQTGIGNDALGVLLGQFTYATDDTSGTSNFNVRAIAAIPDINFGQTTVQGHTGLDGSSNPVGGSSGEYHNFLYMPVRGEDGNTWLNNNLGANYSNVNNSNFNVNQQATSATDVNAYGSLIQGGRFTDGHELTTHTTTGSTPINGSTSIKNDTPTNPLFITSAESWKTTSGTNEWDSVNGINNPCPSGYRVPTEEEFDTWRVASGVEDASASADAAAASNLKLSRSGLRDRGTADIEEIGDYSAYWTATSSDASASSLRRVRFYDSGLILNATRGRAMAYPVRCIRN